MIEVAPGTVAVYTDVFCGWSTVALHRFREARTRLGLDGQVSLDHRLFLLEDVNRFAVPSRVVQPEIPVLGALAPELGWKPWQEDLSTWPNSSLLANEAVHAAKRQSRAAAEELDFALRLALFRDSRCITMRHVILDVAAACARVDEHALRDYLDKGIARGAMLADYDLNRDAVTGSPHFFFADGSDVHDPGIELHWNGEQGSGYPVVDRDDRSVWDDLLKRSIEHVRA